MRIAKPNILVLFVVFLSGCATQTFNLTPRDAAYQKPQIAGAVKVIVSSFEDLRKQKDYVGRIGLTYTQVAAPVGTDLIDAIALELAKEGFNLAKLQVNRSNTEEIVKILKDNNAELLLTGSLDYFYFWSLDALLKSAKGKVDFTLELYNTNGAKVFSKQYSTKSAKRIGFSPRDKYLDLIGQMIDTAVSDLFRDREFMRSLGPADKNNKLLTGMERLMRMHTSGYLSDDEFNKAKARLLE